MDREEALKILQYTDAHCNCDCEKCVYNDDTDHCVFGPINNVIMNALGYYTAMWESQEKYGTIAKEVSLQELYITIKDFRLNLCKTYPCAECPFFKIIHGTVECCLFKAQEIIRETLNNTP